MSLCADAFCRLAYEGCCISLQLIDLQQNFRYKTRRARNATAGNP